MSTKSLDSFASAELAEDALETVSGGAKSNDRAVVAQMSKKDGRAVQVQSAQTKEGKLTYKVDQSKQVAMGKQIAVQQTAVKNNMSKASY